MATLAKLVVKLVTDVSEFTKGLDTASKKLSKVSDSMIKVGNRMTVGLTVPLVAAGTAAVKLASDLEESRNKADVVFGSMAKDIHKFASTAASDMGMTQEEALGFASTYGAMLKNMGLNEDQVAKMSESLTTLTADYGSFHNLNPEEAFEKIKAGLVGASQPLRALGKDLTVTAVQAYAMANGIGSTTGELTNQELALARYGLLLSQSKDEMGDFVRTSDGLANSTKILGALSKELLTSFGEELVPAVTELINVLIPMLKKFNEMSPATKKAIVNFLIIVAAAGPVIRVFGTLGKGLSWLMVKFAGNTAAAAAAGTATTKVGFSFAGLAAKLGLAIKGLAGMKGILTAVGGVLTGVIGPALALAFAILSLVVVLKLLGPTAWESLKMLGAIVKTIFNNLLQNLKALLPNFKNIGQSIMTGMIGGIKSMANSFMMSVIEPITKIVVAVKRALGIRSPSKVFEDIGENIMKGFKKGVYKSSTDEVVARFKYFVSNIQKISEAYQKGLSSGLTPSVTFQSYLNANNKRISAFSSPNGSVIKSQGITQEQVTFSNYEAVGSKSRSFVNNNEFVFYGDMSDSAKKDLKREISNLFDTKMKFILE